MGAPHPYPWQPRPWAALPPHPAVRAVCLWELPGGPEDCACTRVLGQCRGSPARMRVHVRWPHYRTESASGACWEGICMPVCAQVCPLTQCREGGGYMSLPIQFKVGHAPALTHAGLPGACCNSLRSLCLSDVSQHTCVQGEAHSCICGSVGPVPIKEYMFHTK